MYQFKASLLEAAPINTKLDLHVTNHYPLDDQGLSKFDEPITKTAVWTRKNKRDRKAGKREIVVAKQYPLEPDDDYTQDETKPPLKTALLRLIRIAEMYNFKTNLIKKRFWNILDLSEGYYNVGGSVWHVHDEMERMEAQAKEQKERHETEMQKHPRGSEEFKHHQKHFFDWDEQEGKLQEARSHLKDVFPDVFKTGSWSK